MGLKVFEGTKTRLCAFGAAVIMYVTGCAATASADIGKANEELDRLGITYNPENSIETDLIVNAKDVLKQVVQTDELPTKYKEIVISPTLTIDGMNQMCGNVLNANAESLYGNGPATFNYLSLGGLYMDNQAELSIINELGGMIEALSKNPTDEGMNNVLTFIREKSPLLSVGGKKAVSCDLYWLQVIAQIHGLAQDQVNAMALSFGENADIITYIDAITGEVECIR